MKFPDKKLLHKAVFAAIICITFFLSVKVFAQNGIYQLNNKNGSYCYISFMKKGNQAEAEIFAWWNTPSAQTGSYYGSGTLISNKVRLKSNENESDCEVTLSLEQKKLCVSFDNCTVDHLPEDFNGSYTKITNATAGDYTVFAAKSYFHKEPNAASKLNSYVVKGNKVALKLDRIEAGNWVYVYYTDPKGKETEGYILLTDLRKLEI
ncbi:hypothetical protein A0O34_17665 [Chryseobacterium glaciei]|uniref:Uncharacterized protein n=1 Tax=Chryseobacterium glaciei TaxID=1685010 RepID=A0A172XYY9_9FLAO|nr:hypothetical protein [Chryseobacterium glaciei]ANF52233.1 hypothetical protein A0O34_17665 [Chryseobacterium glaciei]